MGQVLERGRAAAPALPPGDLTLPVRALAIALITVLLVAQGALAGDGFSAPIVLRTAPSGRSLVAADVAARKASVAVVWQEHDAADGGSPRIRLRTSLDGGKTFTSKWLIKSGGIHRDASVDVCAGRAWVIYTKRIAASWPSEVELSDVRVDGGPPATYHVAGSADGPEAYHPDVACVGSRRQILAWVDETGDVDDLRVRFMPFGDGIHIGPLAAERSGSLSVAATSSRAYVAWVWTDPANAEEHLRVKAFDVGPGRFGDVDSLPAVTLPDVLEGGGGRPQLAASGQTVVLAYTRQSDLWVTISTNGGSSFNGPQRLIDTQGGADAVARAVSVDIVGADAVVNAVALSESVPDVAAQTMRFTSQNAGASWPGLTKEGSGGERSGALTVIDGESRIVEAWDSSYEPASPQALRFHRQK